MRIAFETQLDQANSSQSTSSILRMHDIENKEEQTVKTAKTIRLDKTRLHGFRINRSSTAEPAQCIEKIARPGSKLGAKVGTKGGAKVGMKN